MKSLFGCFTVLLVVAITESDAVTCAGNDCNDPRCELPFTLCQGDYCYASRTNIGNGLLINYQRGCSTPESPIGNCNLTTMQFSIVQTIFCCESTSTCNLDVNFDEIPSSVPPTSSTAPPSTTSPKLNESSGDGSGIFLNIPYDEQVTASHVTTSSATFMREMSISGGPFSSGVSGYHSISPSTTLLFGSSPITSSPITASPNASSLSVTSSVASSLNISHGDVHQLPGAGSILLNPTSIPTSQCYESYSSSTSNSSEVSFCSLERFCYSQQQRTSSGTVMYKRGCTTKQCVNTISNTMIKRCCTSSLCNDFIPDRTIPPPPHPVTTPTTSPPTKRSLLTCYCDYCGESILCKTTVACGSLFVFNKMKTYTIKKLCLQSMELCEVNGDSYAYLLCCNENFCNNHTAHDPSSEAIAVTTIFQHFNESTSDDSTNSRISAPPTFVPNDKMYIGIATGVFCVSIVVLLIVMISVVAFCISLKMRTVHQRPRGNQPRNLKNNNKKTYGTCDSIKFNV